MRFFFLLSALATSPFLRDSGRSFSWFYSTAGDLQPCRRDTLFLAMLLKIDTRPADLAA